MSNPTLDPSAFDQLVTRHRAPVYGYLHARLPESSQAEELTLAIFMQLYREQPQFADEIELQNWLRDASRAALEVLVRSETKRNRFGWTSLCLDAEREDNLPPADIAPRLESLAPMLRKSLELTYAFGYSPKQVGEHLRRSETAVRELLSRAKARLRSTAEPTLGSDESPMPEENR